MPALSRRDQARALRFLSKRLSLALIRDEPDAPDDPMRKLAVAAVSGVMTGALVVAAFGVLALLAPGGSTSWTNGQSLILEKDTGALFVFSGGKLYPVLNYASARLALGQASPGVVSVSAASLRSTPRGPQIGIPGAPDELPTAATLTAGAWSVCSRPVADTSGGAYPYVWVTVGQTPLGTALTSSHAILVTAQNRTIYLVWNDQRLRVPGGTGELTALGYGTEVPVPVGDAWLSALPQGPDLTTPPIARAGHAGVTVAGTRYRIGQVFVSSDTAGAGTVRYYVMLGDGLSPVSETQADLLLASSVSHGGSGQAVTISAAVAAAARSRSSVSAAGLPASPPALVSSAGGQLVVCESYRAGSNGVPEVSTRLVPESDLPAASAASPTEVSGTTGVALANKVLVTPGGGAVAEAVASPGAVTGTLYLITDQGVKYPLPDSSVLQPLGLSGVTPSRLPVAVLDLLPTGPTLDKQAALKTVTP